MLYVFSMSKEIALIGEQEKYISAKTVYGIVHRGLLPPISGAYESDELYDVVTQLHRAANVRREAEEALNRLYARTV